MPSLNTRNSGWSPLDDEDDREGSVEGPVCDFAQRKGWFCRKMKWIGRGGGPDRFFAKDGRIILIEFKRPGKKRADPLQKREHRRLRAYGIEVHLINDIEAGCALFA